MATNNITYSSEQIVDLASDTVTSETLEQGITAHDATGAKIVGTSTSVQYGKTQSLTEAQKRKARENIDALYKDSLSRSVLDNGNFRVNQRGQTSYTGSGYGVDRWRTNFSGDTVKVESTGVRNTVSSTSTGWHLHQILNNVSQFIGKTLTASCYINTVYGNYFHFLISFRDSSDNEISHVNKAIAAGLNFVSSVVPTGTSFIRVGFYAYSGVAIDDYFSVKWVALYDGTYTANTIPPYQDKGYAAELLECQRYYIKIGTGGTCGHVTSNATSYRIFVPLPTVMRVAPTAKPFTVIMRMGQSGYSGLSPSATEYTVSDATVTRAHIDTVAMITFTSDSAVDTNNSIFQCAFYDLELSADL